MHMERFIGATDRVFEGVPAAAFGTMADARSALATLQRRFLAPTESLRAAIEYELAGGR
jgi:hypothetical protein